MSSRISTIHLFALCFFVIPPVIASDFFDEKKTSYCIPLTAAVIKVCDEATKTGLRKSQKDTIIKLHRDYMQKHDRAAYFKALDACVSSKKILGCHAKAIKDVCDPSKFDFRPIPRGNPGHEAMKNAYMVISGQNKIICLGDGYKTKAGVKIVGLDIKKAIQSSQTVKFDSLSASRPTQSNRTIVQVIDQDTLAGAHDLQAVCGKVAILNFANAYSPGGGYLGGCNAQEEDLCRRTTLFPVLNCMKKTHHMYPIAHDALIYSEGVKVIRKSNKDKFALLDQPESVCVITSAAYNLKPKARNSDAGLKEAHYKSGTWKKILLQLRVAKLKNCDGLVLGAFGCGAFQNDPEVIAKMYAEALARDEFKGQFKYVRFSIPKGGKNFSVFSKHIK